MSEHLLPTQITVDPAISDRIAEVADRWRDFEWELIRPTPMAPNMNLALDEVLTSAVGQGERLDGIATGDGVMNGLQHADPAGVRSNPQLYPAAPNRTEPRRQRGDTGPAWQRRHRLARPASTASTQSSPASASLAHSRMMKSSA